MKDFNAQISEYILQHSSGRFLFYGANICFFKEGSIYNFVFPFVVFSYSFETLRDNPHEIFMKIAGYINDLRNLGHDLI